MYTRAQDYVLYCDAQTLTQIVDKDLSLKRLCEYAAEDQIRSYLSQRYDFKKPYGEFTDTNIYSNTTTYKGNDRVYLDGTVWVSGTYSTNNIVLYSNGNVYLKNSNTVSYVAQIPTDTNYWTLLGVQFDLFFITLPADPWDYTRQYNIGDQIWFRDNIFTAGIQSKNIAPNSQYGINYWGAGIPYSVIAGTLPTDTTKWTNGDNRNNYLLQLYIAIVIYNMMLKAAPKNIPQPRTDAYDQCLAWLKDAGAGLVTAELPELAPEQGSSLRWGSIPLSNNIY